MYTSCRSYWTPSAAGFCTRFGVSAHHVKVGSGLRASEIDAPLEGSVVGKMVSSGESVIDNQLDSHPGFHRDAALQTGFVTRSMIGAPIRRLAGGHVIGPL